MKKLLGLLAVFAFMIIATAEVAGCGTTFIYKVWGSAGGALLMAPPVTLTTQKIVFLSSLKEEYNKIDTWLNEAEDLSSFVDQGQTLVFPEAGADPAVYKNRVTDVDDVEPSETTHKVELDVYDSQNYKLRNILLHALPFDKIQHYTRKSADAIIRQEIADAAYAFAPTTAGNKRLVIPTSGPVVGGYKTLTLEDIILFATMCDNAEFPEGRNLVLPSDLWWQLVNNNEILKGQLKNMQQTGTIMPSIVDYYGFKIHKSLGNKLGVAWDVNANAKAAQGATIVGDVVPSALLFCKNEVFRAGGNMEMFFKNKSENTSGRAYEFGFQHRFKSDFQMSAQRYSGLIYSVPDAGTVVINTETIELSKLVDGTNLIAAVADDEVTLTAQHPAVIDEVLTDYVSDALIQLSEELPIGTEIVIELGEATIGTATLVAAVSEIYLSELIKLAAPTATVRPSIVDAAGVTQVYTFTITPLASYEGDVTVKTQVSKNAVTFANARTLAVAEFALDITVA